MASADTIQLASGAELAIYFAMPGFSPNDSAAVFPTTIGLDLAGSVSAGAGVGSIPGSTQQYYSGILLQGSLQSLSGSVSLPLFDADAWRLGLPTGDIVADATGGVTAMAEAEVAVSLNASEAIFGTTGQAEFVVKNLGGAITLGLGPGYSLSNAILAPLSAQNGGVQTAGYVQSLNLISPNAIFPNTITATVVPEPAPFGVAAVGVTALFWLRRKLRR